MTQKAPRMHLQFAEHDVCCEVDLQRPQPMAATVLRRTGSGWVLSSSSSSVYNHRRYAIGYATETVLPVCKLVSIYIKSAIDAAIDAQLIVSLHARSTNFYAKAPEEIINCVR